MHSTHRRSIAVVLAVACCVALAACMLFSPLQVLQGTFSSITAAAAAAGSLLLQHTPTINPPGRTFGIENDRFMLDGQPVQLLSGSVHYNRIPPDQWHERLAAVKAMGLNAIQVCGALLLCTECCGCLVCVHSVTLKGV